MGKKVISLVLSIMLVIGSSIIVVSAADYDDPWGPDAAIIKQINR